MGNNLIRFIFFILVLFLIGCELSFEFSDNKNLKNNKSKTIFKLDVDECLLFSQQTFDRPEGSKRAGEVFLENKENFLKCMSKKGWVKKRI